MTAWVWFIPSLLESGWSIISCSTRLQMFYGTRKRNGEDYVLRLPTQSFDQRPGNIRKSALILTTLLLLAFCSYFGRPPPLSKLLSVRRIIKPCGTVSGPSFLTCQKLVGGRSNAFETDEMKTINCQIAEDSLLYFNPYSVLYIKKFCPALTEVWNVLLFDLKYYNQEKSMGSYWEKKDSTNQKVQYC